MESSFKSTGDRDFVTIVSKTITVNKAYNTDATPDVVQYAVNPVVSLGLGLRLYMTKHYSK